MLDFARHRPSRRKDRLKKLRRLFIATWVACACLAKAAPVHAEDAATARARQLFQEGQKQFDLGNWDAAARGFSQAYELRPDPKLLYNMAQAYRRGGNARRAVDLYKNYLMKDPKSPLRAEVEERIRGLQRQIDDEDKRSPGSPGATPAPLPASAETKDAQRGAVTKAEPALAPPPQPTAPMPATTEPPPQAPSTPAVASEAKGGGPPPQVAAEEVPSPAASLPEPAATATAAPAVPPSHAAANPGSRLRLAGAIAAGLGIASGAAGVFFSYRTRSLSTRVSNAPQFNPGDADAGKRAEVAQWICYGAGAALAVTGGLLYWRGRKTASPQVALAPWLASSSGGIAAVGVFR